MDPLGQARSVMARVSEFDTPTDAVPYVLLDIAESLRTIADTLGDIRNQAHG